MSDALQTWAIAVLAIVVLVVAIALLTHVRGDEDPDG